MVNTPLHSQDIIERLTYLELVDTSLMKVLLTIKDSPIPSVTKTHEEAHTVMINLLRAFSLHTVYSAIPRNKLVELIKDRSYAPILIGVYYGMMAHFGPIIFARLLDEVNDIVRKSEMDLTASYLSELTPVVFKHSSTSELSNASEISEVEVFLSKKEIQTIIIYKVFCKEILRGRDADT